MKISIIRFLGKITYRCYFREQEQERKRLAFHARDHDDNQGLLFFRGKFCQILLRSLRNSAALLSPHTVHSAASARCSINCQHFKV